MNALTNNVCVEDSERDLVDSKREGSRGDDINNVEYCYGVNYESVAVYVSAFEEGEEKSLSGR